MSSNSDPTIEDIVRHIRAFIMVSLAADAVALRPDMPRIRGPLTPVAREIFRALVFCFENVLTGLCIPSIATLAGAAACSQSSVNRLLVPLYETEYLSWRHGKRKRVWTKKGWRVVRSSNRYQIFCPRRHLAALRRMLLRAYGGKDGPLIQKLIARYTPPTEEAKTTEKIVETLAADLRSSTKQTDSTIPPSRAPHPTRESVQVGGITVENPKLGSVLSGIWEALEKQGR